VLETKLLLSTSKYVANNATPNVSTTAIQGAWSVESRYFITATPVIMRPLK